MFVEKYISDCNILVGGRKYSTDELVEYMNNQGAQIDALQERVDVLEDSLEIYKASNMERIAMIMVLHLFIAGIHQRSDAAAKRSGDKQR